MKRIYLIDTNVLTYYMDGCKFCRELIDGNTCRVSAITVEEVEYGLCLPKAKNKSLNSRVQALLEKFEVVPFCEGMGKESGRVRALLKKKGIYVSENDAKIGTTALYNNFTLVSADGVFKHFPSLKLKLIRI